MPKYSQNFLTDNKTAQQIADALAQNDFDYLVEIGPGRGFLTKRLINKFGSDFSVVEIDADMITQLKQNISPENLPHIIHNDFLKLDLEKKFLHKKIAFAGNLPYASANPIMQKVLNFRYFSSAVFMFQKEVADRITAKTNDAEYGVLTLSVRIKAEVHRICKVKKSYFRPMPKVDSAVVGFKKLSKPVLKTASQEKIFLKTVKLAFAHRRKTVLNSLSKSLNRDKTQVAQMLKVAEISPVLRPQNVSIHQYIKLAETIF